MKERNHIIERNIKSFIFSRLKGLFIIGFIFLFLFVSTTGRATVISSWQFYGLTGGLNNYGPSPMSPTSSDAHVSVGGLTRGTGFTLLNSAAANAWGGNGLTETSKDNAISSTDYAYFSITVNSGYILSISGFDAYNIRRSGTGPTTGQWQYQVGSASFVDIGSSITWGGVTTATGNPQSAIDLSGISALQNIPAGTTITFRVVLWNGSSAGNWYFNGNASIPLTLNGSLCEIPSLSFPTSTLNKVEGDASFTQTATSNSPATISYTSNNPSVASVNSTTGQVTLGTVRGSAIITATQGSSGSYCAATATYNIEYDCGIITLTGTNSICKNESTTLVPGITGGTWSSDTPAVAGVTNGVVTGNDNGTAIITYTSPAGCKKNETITVYSLPQTNDITHE